MNNGERLKLMIDAIKNFHKVYYAMGDSKEDWLELHHAAEHLFDAAEIKISIAPDGANQKFIEDALDGKRPPKDLEDAWARINKSYE